MDMQTIIDGINAKASSVPAIGASIKFEVGTDIIFVDGTGDSNVISTDNRDADCTIITSLETFKGLQTGDINPMMAVMSGKVKIKGDMGVAMKLQSLLG